MKQKKKMGVKKIVLLSVGVLIVVAIILLVKNEYGPKDANITAVKYKTYQSNDLKIIFNYPVKWYMQEKNREVMITSYETTMGDNLKPTSSQVKIFIDNASLCQPTLDQEIALGGCGEGLNTKNEILSKIVEKVPAGDFVSYAIKYPTGQDATLYYLKQKDRILHISKKPDPSVFEKDFKDIIYSIRFLE